MAEWVEFLSLCRTYGLNVLKDEPLAKHTTFSIGGACTAFVSIDSIEALCALVAFCREQALPFFVLGRGSNVLVADEGYEGVILHLGSDFAKITPVGETEFSCEAGASLGAVSRLSCERQLTGMEGLSGIPGTIGGALYMNAGAYGYEMANIVRRAVVLTQTGEVVTLETAEMELGYRESIFAHNGGIILSVTIELKAGDSAEIATKMAEYARARREKQPLDYPSAGSTFRRPVGNYASALIDACGLCGRRVGGAMVSKKHAGFIVNMGGATCADVLELSREVQEIVEAKTGYRLELEPVVVGK